MRAATATGCGRPLQRDAGDHWNAGSRHGEEAAHRRDVLEDVHHDDRVEVVVVEGADLLGADLVQRRRVLLAVDAELAVAEWRVRRLGLIHEQRVGERHRIDAPRLRARAEQPLELGEGAAAELEHVAQVRRHAA
eukprot:3282184-Prymnesium_polylepis.1